MPEMQSMYPYSSTPEPQKKKPIKVSCGIGDSDGFPAFDVDSDTYASKDDSKWNFLITGGAEFHMPLTVFQVTPDGLADKAGIRLGDIILEINEEDATQLTLSQAHEKINASGKKIQFLVKSMEDDENLEYETGEERSIVMRVPKPMPPPKAKSIEKRLREMQRKLTEIAEIPKILSSTLATVSQTFDKLLPNVVGGGGGGGVELNSSSQAEHKPEQLRKFSYDEDAVDYALNVGADDDDDDFDENGEHVGESVDDDDDNDRYDDAASTLSDNADNDEIERDLHKLKSKLRDLTPESDYASSESDVNDENEYDDDDENYADAGAGVHANASEIDDFLTTSFTWRMRKLPKIFLNGQPKECNTDSSADDEDDNQDDDDDDEEQLTTVRLPAPKMPQNENNQQPQNQEKRTPLELAWPWADSRKIIYKQSTCHLVPRKCGIIERSKQLLAQRNLFDFNQYHKLEQPQRQQQQQQHK